MSMSNEFLSAEEAKGVLDDAEMQLREFLAAQRMISVYSERHAFSSHTYVRSAGLHDFEWTGFYRELCGKVSSITSAVNTERKLTGSSQLNGAVYGEPVHTWQGPALMMDLNTGQIPGGRRQNTLDAGFYVPHRYT